MADARYLRIADPLPLALAAGMTATNVVLDANTEKIAWVFQMPEDATLTHAGFLYGARTGTCPTYRISLQALGTDGNPDGTPLGGGSPASATFTPPATAAWNGTWQWVALSNSYAATRGQRLAVVIDYSAGTIDGSNNSSFTRGFTNASAAFHGFPFATQDITGSWAKQVTHPSFGVKSASQVYGFPMESSFSTAMTSSGNRQALRFVLNSGFGSTFQVAGLRFNGEINAAGSDFKIGVWLASDGSELEAITLDGDLAGSTGSNNLFEFYFDSLVSLSFGTAYYAGLESGAGTSYRVRGLVMDTANDMKAMSGGDGFYLATYNGATWTEDTTNRPLMQLIIADWTEPVGGGGGATQLIGGGLVRS
jgi:hypothetical protein